MQLKDFISETIKQITDGLLEGSAYVKERSNSSEGVRDDYTKINFDVAVTSNEENKDDLGGKVSVVQVFSAGASTSKSSNTSNHNRIQFEILIAVNTQ